MGTPRLTRSVKVGLPPRPFLYTFDQIAMIISVNEAVVRQRYIYYEGRNEGMKLRHQMTARNIAPPEDPPEWRVGEQELIRWMQYKGFKFYDRAGLYSDATPLFGDKLNQDNVLPDIPDEPVDDPYEGG